VGTRFSTRPNLPWTPPNLLYNGYRVFPGGKVRPGRAADHSPASSAAVMEQYSYTSTHPLGHTGPVTVSLYLIYLATQLRAGGPRSNPGGDEIFHTSRPALWSTQPPVKWVPGLSRDKVRPGRAADHSSPSSAAVMEQYSYNSTHPLGHIGPVTGSLYLYIYFS